MNFLSILFHLHFVNLAIKIGFLFVTSTCLQIEFSNLVSVAYLVSYVAYTDKFWQRNACSLMN
jgi:hypothetical protein